jgi:uncharacterized protein
LQAKPRERRLSGPTTLQLHGDALVVMAKEPCPGAVKTRLARKWGAAAAAHLYGAFLRDLAHRLSGASWQLVWAVQPAGADFLPWAGDAALCVDQEGDDLAERMYRCFERLFGAGAVRVVMIGGDVPQLPPALAETAFACLQQCDAVIAPSGDGGYSLVGLVRLVDLFRGIEMSTPRVLEQTRRRAAALGLHVRELDPVFDVDEPKDVERLREQILHGRVDLPHTAEALARMS